MRACAETAEKTVPVTVRPSSAQREHQDQAPDDSCKRDVVEHSENRDQNQFRERT